MKIRLLLDENASDHALTNLLCKAGHDTVWLQELALFGTADENILFIARKEKRVLYTRDRDFLKIIKEVKTHSGIIFEYRNKNSNHMTPAQIVKALAVIEKTYASLKNQLVVINTFRQ